MFKKQKWKRVITISDLKEKDRVETLLGQQQIEYRMEMRAGHTGSMFASALLGTAVGGQAKPRYLWDCYVNEKDEKRAASLLDE